MRSLIVFLAIALAFGPVFAPAPADARSPRMAAATGEKEAPMSMDQVPAAVKSAAEKEAKGGTLGSVVKETEKGKTFYEVEISKDGKNRYVHISRAARS